MTPSPRRADCRRYSPVSAGKPAWTERGTTLVATSSQSGREPPAGRVQVSLVWRDNEEHRDDIERHYLKMLTARREVTTANAYSSPPIDFYTPCVKRARRGVRIKLIIPGRTGYADCQIGARLLYNYLVKGGVQVFEYRRRPLHGKVALMDDHWAT
ncbi:phospholipase D-like domain-containing protein [Shigella flexneri]